MLAVYTYLMFHDVASPDLSELCDIFNFRLFAGKWDNDYFLNLRCQSQHFASLWDIWILKTLSCPKGCFYKYTLKNYLKLSTLVLYQILFNSGRVWNPDPMHFRGNDSDSRGHMHHWAMKKPESAHARLNTRTAIFWQCHLKELRFMHQTSLQIICFFPSPAKPHNSDPAKL